VHKKNPQTEEYLEMLVRYAELGRRPKVKELARDLGISSASVSEMLRKLSENGYVRYKPYEEIKITGKGERLGKSVLRKHHLIEQFLELVGLRKDRIHKEACILEHALSDDVERGLRRAVRRLGKTPMGIKDARRLVDLTKGESGVILLLDCGRSACRRLMDMGLTPGTIITVERSSSRLGPVEISVRSSTLAVGRGIAEKIFVKVGR
jgi:DtxR family Mn-dependent transcriptional regulator